MAFESFMKVTGVIQNIRSGNSCCTQMVSITTEDGPGNLVVSGDTMVVDNVRLRRGMRIAAFYDGNLPAPAIYPPQYQAELIASLRRNQDVTLKFFDSSMTAADNSLQLNLSPLTPIETMNGQRFLCRPENQELLVFYTTTTFSIPPQTTPQRIIVMCPMQ